MNDIINAVLLGLVEGLTEFLPVSSTAHLLVAENMLGLNKQDWEAFTVVIQLGAVLSVVAVYWRKFWDVTVGLPTDPKARQFAANVIVAFLPAALIGVLLIKFINGVLLDPARALPLIGVNWILGGVLIFLFEKIAPRPRWEGTDNLPLIKALQIGLCQCAALASGRVAIRGQRFWAPNCSAWSARQRRISRSISPCRPCWARPCLNSTRSGQSYPPAILRLSRSGSSSPLSLPMAW